MVVVLVGLFRDLIVTVIIKWGVVQYAFLWMFAQSGLKIISALILFVLIGGIAYWSKGRDRKAIALKRSPRQQRTIRWTTLAVLGLLTLLLPVILGSYFSEILDNVGIYILMGLGLNIVVGFAGLLDLGYVAFYAIGAYTLGVLTTTEAVGLLHLSFWAGSTLCFDRGCIRRRHPWPACLKDAWRLPGYRHPRVLGRSSASWCSLTG